MNRSAEWFEAGQAGACPALWALRGTFGTFRRGRSTRDVLIEPRHVIGQDGRCKHCNEGRKR